MASRVSASLLRRPHAKLPIDAWQGIDVDMNAMPDAAMTLAVAALFADGPTAIRNVGNWRVKETERMASGVGERMKGRNIGAWC